MGRRITLRILLQEIPVTWIGVVSYMDLGAHGSALSDEEREEVRAMLLSHRCVAIFLEPEMERQYYNGFCAFLPLTMCRMPTH